MYPQGKKTNSTVNINGSCVKQIYTSVKLIHTRVKQKESAVKQKYGCVKQKDVNLR